jgi:NAD(P)H-dependent flavin oxidoreductase YrpB (nitropropane dioxygenase family)
MKTRITELLGCKYPILQGAMAGLGDWRFAAAVANAGAHGTITASVSGTPERLAADIAHCRAATDGSFGVNLSFGICPRIEEMLEVCIAAQVPVETALYKPDSLAPRIKASRLRWIHKSARIKDAVHAEHLGADAIIVVGLEGTGFKSPEQLPTMTSVVWGTRKIGVPLIAAGGIADARGFVGALGMGAEAVMMGTAFMLTRESPLKESMKNEILKTSPDDARLLRRVLGSPDPRAYAEVQAMRGKVPLDEWLRMLERVNLKDDRPLESAGSGPGRESGTDHVVSAADPTRMVSLALAGIDHIPTVMELVDGIIRGAQEIFGRLDRMRA